MAPTKPTSGSKLIATRVPTRGSRWGTWQLPTPWSAVRSALVLIALVATITVGIAGIAACQPAPTPALGALRAEPTEVGPIDDPLVLEQYLAENGLALPPSETIEHEWFDVPARSYPLTEDDTSALLVYPYPSEDEASAALASLSMGAQVVTRPDGERIQIAWPDAPHVYLAGPMLVIYVGGEAQVMHLLTLGLGPQVAGPVPPPGVGVR